MKITPELLKRYQSNQCNAEEIKEVEEWLHSTADELSNLSEKKLKNMEQDIWRNLAPSHLKNSNTKIVFLHRRAVSYAAAAVILFTVGFFTYSYLDNPVPKIDMAYFSDFNSIETQRGQKRTMKLSDGTIIRLNYESEVKVPEQFEGDERVIYLTGHAHFDVAHNPEKPFIIYTQDSKTQVLGTSFDINTSKKEGETEVIVTSGKVAFSVKDQVDNLVTLSINDRAVLGPDKMITKSNVDAEKLTAWKDNKLVFDGESLQEVIRVIEPWYDVQVVVENSDLLTEDFKLHMDNPSLEITLEELAFLAGFDYRIEGDKVVIF
ncbi:MAG: FecR domain-containing protein [Bacteroidota bacterium]